MSIITQQKDALEALKNLAEDIAMLASGEWVPDDDSCDSSLASIERVRVFVANLQL